MLCKENPDEWRMLLRATTAIGADLSFPRTMGHQISGTKELARKVARENRNNVKEAKVDQSTRWFPSQMTIARFVLHTMHKAAKAAAAEFMFVGCGDVANRIQCGNITKA